MAGSIIPAKIVPETPLDPPLPAAIIKRQLGDREAEDRDRRLEEPSSVGEVLDGD
jgi:hypothetical protein